MLSTVKNLNRLPVITWRWLKVNELTLNNYSLPHIEEYNKNVILSKEHGNVSVRQGTNNLELLNNLFYRNLDFGVSKEFVEFGEKFYNIGLTIHAPKGEKLENPIIISYDMEESNPNVVENSVIIAEENSEISVIIKYNTLDEFKAFHNGVTKIYAKDGAVVNIIKVQTMNDESHHFDSNVAHIGYGAKVNFISVELGAHLSVTNYISNLEEATAECDLKSIYLGHGDRTLDMSYEMKHLGRRTLSNIETKGVLKDNSKKTFRGTLNFKKGSSRSKGSEEEYAILLDPKVKSDAIPLLLCEEDDVEGAHAASAGKIDEHKLFYIMSRGFNEKEAKKLIVEASFRPIIDLIPNEEIQNNIHLEIQRRILNE